MDYDDNAARKTYNRGTRRLLLWLLLAILLLAVWLIGWAYWATGSLPGLGALTGDNGDSTAAIVSDDGAETDGTETDGAETDDAAVQAGEDDQSAGDETESTIEVDTAADDTTTDDTTDDSADATAEGGTVAEVVPADLTAATDSDSADSDSADSDSADSDSADGDAQSVDSASAQPAPTPISIVLNSTLVVADVVRDSRELGLRLYAKASSESPTREIYAVGERLTLIEPSDDFDAYPVLVDGVSWVRVRDGDGLIGWVDWSLLVSE